MMSRPILCALLVACSLPDVAADSSGFSAGIEEGKAYGAAANAAMPNAAELDATAVPGFETSSPPQTTYYGNPSAMGDAASQAAHDNEAAQAVTEGFVSRPMFTIDRETDPMFVRMGQVEANAASIAGAMQGEYSECRPVVLETPHPPTTETCYESRTKETHTCDNALRIEVTEGPLSCQAGSVLASQSLSAPYIGSLSYSVTCLNEYAYRISITVSVPGKYYSGYCWSNTSTNTFDIAFGQSHAWQPYNTSGVRQQVLISDEGSDNTTARLRVRFMRGYNYLFDNSSYVYSWIGWDREFCTYDETGSYNCYTACTGTYTGDEAVSTKNIAGGAFNECYIKTKFGHNAIDTGVIEFARPVKTYNIIDHWDDGCTALEARSQ